MLPQNTPYENTDSLLQALEEVVEKLGIELRYERLNTQEDFTVHSGMYQFKGQSTLLVNRNLSDKEKTAILLEGLQTQDLSQIYISPALRNLFESSHKTKD